MSQSLFKWKYYEKGIILLCVGWYLKYSLRYRNLVEMIEERVLAIFHTIIVRRVHRKKGKSLEEFSKIIENECFVHN